MLISAISAVGLVEFLDTPGHSRRHTRGGLSKSKVRNLHANRELAQTLRIVTYSSLMVHRSVYA